MLKKAEYYLYYALLYSFSLLPFPVLLGLGNVIAFLMGSIFRYRSAVIQDNLKKSFPDWSQEKVEAVQQAFYKHFAEVMVTSLKLVSLPHRKISKHLKIINPELMEILHENGESVLLVIGHYANWEWFGPVVYNHPQFIRQGIYRPIKNQAVDKLMRQARGRFTDQLVPQEKVARTLLSQRDKTALSILIADQAPSNLDLSVWVDFVGRRTPFYNSVERLAIKSGQQVVFGNMKKLGRAKYSVEYELIEGENIIEQYAAKLEAQIRHQPELYLWSHRRWKHEDKSGNE